MPIVSAARPRRRIAWGIGAFVALLAALWGAGALWYQVPGGRGVAGAAALAWLGFAWCCLRRDRRRRARTGLAAVAVGVLALLGWFLSLSPSNQRDWADDVAMMTTGTVQGDRVTLSHVRDFDWRTETDYTPRWTPRTYDLSTLRSVDMVLSYWMGPAIAHTLVSFGFDNGEHVVFSVEIRKERHESFSAIGGFFRKFENSVIAATERDIVYVRTNVRGEDDYLYRVDMAPDAMRSLFLAYVDEANALVQAPQFYNTLTANCTTIVWHMMRRIVPTLPMDPRLIASGYLPGYVFDVGGLQPGVPLDALRARGRITDRARASSAGPGFSAAIRAGVPGWSDAPAQ